MGEGSQKYFGTYQQIKKTPILSAGDEIKAELSNKNCGFRSTEVQKYFAGDNNQQMTETPILPTREEVNAEVRDKNCDFRLGRGPKNILILSNKLIKHQYCKLVTRWKQRY